LPDAKALELQVRQNAGPVAAPQDQSDEELKLLAIQGLQQADPEQAVPMLEKILQGTASPELKARALFVLAQSNSPRARQVLTAVAKGGSNPDVQRRAIQYLGVNGTTEKPRHPRRDLPEARATSTSSARFLRSFMVSGDKARMISVGRPRRCRSYRPGKAVRQLGAMGAKDELWTMYQKESDAGSEGGQILGSLFVSGDATHLIEGGANTEQNSELRLRAVQHHRHHGPHAEGDALVGIYAKEKDGRHQAPGHQRAVHAGQRRSAGGDRPQGNRSRAQARDGLEALADDEVEGRHGLLDGDLEQVRVLVAALTVAFATDRSPAGRRRPALQRPHRDRTRRPTSRAMCRPWPRR
jgi:hypothetical protein